MHCAPRACLREACLREARAAHHQVHMLFDGQFHTEWAPDEPRMSRFVFIGEGVARVPPSGSSSSIALLC